MHAMSSQTMWDTPALPRGSWEGGFRSFREQMRQMIMRRFFRAHRDEDFSQIQYLTAKCTRLAHDKGKSQRSRRVQLTVNLLSTWKLLVYYKGEKKPSSPFRKVIMLSPLRRSDYSQVVDQMSTTQCLYS